MVSREGLSGVCRTVEPPVGKVPPRVGGESDPDAERRSVAEEAPASGDSGGMVSGVRPGSSACAGGFRSEDMANLWARARQEDGLDYGPLRGGPPADSLEAECCVSPAPVGVPASAGFRSRTG